LVPVGLDQKQHLEIARDIAGYFNQTYAETFPLPEGKYSDVPKVPGTTKDENGQFQKMSKSYKNAIEIFLEGKELKSKVMGIQTDSTPVENPKDPSQCIVFSLYSLFASREEREDLAQRYRNGGLGYGEAKKLLLKKMDEHLGPAREKRKRLASDPSTVQDILRAGARRARSIAQATMEEVYSVTGLPKTKGA
jgi:tryptophanyl-tRNA synthetase